MKKNKVGKKRKKKVSKIYEELIKLNTQKTKKSNQEMGRRHEQTFLQRRHKNGQQTLKKCSTSLAIREIQIKTTLRYHLTPVRMATINKTGNNKC